MNIFKSLEAAQGLYNRAALSGIDADQAAWAAQETLRVGRAAQEDQAKKSRSRIGRVKSALAARNVDVGTGVGLDLVEQQRDISAEEALRMQNAYAAKSLSFRQKASSARAQRDIYRQAAVGQLVVGAAGAYGDYRFATRQKGTGGSENGVQF